MKRVTVSCLTACILMVGIQDPSIALPGRMAVGMSIPNNTGQPADDWEAVYVVPPTCPDTIIKDLPGWNISPDGRSASIHLDIGPVAPGANWTSPTWSGVMEGGGITCPNQLVPASMQFTSGGVAIGNNPGVGYVSNDDGNGGVVISLVNGMSAGEWVKNVEILFGYPYLDSEVIPGFTPPASYAFTTLTPYVDLLPGADISWDFTTILPGTPTLLKYEVQWDSIPDPPGVGPAPVTGIYGCQGIPEPSTLALLGLGATGILARRKKPGNSNLAN